MEGLITNTTRVDCSTPGTLALTIDDQPGPRIELPTLFRTLVDGAVAAYDGKSLAQWADVFIDLADLCRTKAQ